MNQSAQQGLVADDLDVMLDAGTVGDAIEQRRNVGHVANSLKFLVSAQLLNQGDDVDRPRRLGQIDHARVNAPVRIEREIFRAQMLGGLVIGKIVEQNGAENGALGFDAGRKCADAVVGSCQTVPRAEFLTFVRIQILKLWNPVRTQRKTETQSTFFGCRNAHPQPTDYVERMKSESQ